MQRKIEGRSSGRVMRQEAGAGRHAVDARRLVEMLRDALQPGQQDDHVEAQHLPEVGQDHAGQRPVEALQELHRLVESPLERST